LIFFKILILLSFTLIILQGGFGCHIHPHSLHIFSILNLNTHWPIHSHSIFLHLHSHITFTYSSSPFSHIHLPSFTYILFIPHTSTFPIFHSSSFLYLALSIHIYSTHTFIPHSSQPLWSFPNILHLLYFPLVLLPN